MTRINQQEHIHYSEKRACELVKQMVSAVRYCHEHGIVHRDLKLENFLFQSKRSDSPLILIDFGFSQHFTHDKVIKKSSIGLFLIN